MKTTTTYLIAFLLVFLGFQKIAFAQPNLYLCNTGTATLLASPEGVANGTYASTDVITWKHTFNSSTSTVQSGAGTNAEKYVLPTNLAVGEHTYTAEVSSAVPCASDVSTSFTVYKLPTFTVALANPTDLNYCTYESAVGSVLVATVTLQSGTTLPSDVNMDYTWTVKKTVSGVESTPTLSDVGAAVSSGTSLTTNTFTMNASAVGTYNFEVKSRFKSTANIPIKSGATPDAACEATASNKPDVIVSPKPTKPAISIM